MGAGYAYSESQAVSAYIQRPDGSAVYFDLTSEEHHTGEAKVTKLPVEEGPDVNDHMRAEPRPLALRAFTSNTPLEPSGNQAGIKRGSTDVLGSVDIDITPFKPKKTIAGAIAQAVINPVGFVTNALTDDDSKKTATISVIKFPYEFNAPKDTLELLKEMQDNAELLTVFTSVDEYENVVLERYAMTRNAETGTGAEIEMFFVPLRIVKVTTAATPITTEPQVKTVKKAGKKDPEPEVPRASVAKNLSQNDTNKNLFTGKPE